MGEPSSKAKYDTFSDSEEYCKGKIKRKSMTSEIEPELVVLQADRGLRSDVVPFA